jgi:hypothetical protein
MCERYYETVLMLGSETEQEKLCTDLYIMNSGTIHEVEQNGNSCTRILDNNTLLRCLYEESSLTPSTACTTLITLQQSRHQYLYGALKVLATADMIAATDDNEKEPTDWIPLCYKFKDNVTDQCTFLTNGIVTDLTSACITDPKLVANKATPMCQR